MLNVDKTQELIVDFRKCRNLKDSIIINSSAVEHLDIHKYLGLTVMNTSSWTQNADKRIKNGRKKYLFFLHILKSYNGSIDVMINFYCAVIESILTANILVWFGCTNKREIQKIESIIRTAERIIVTSLRTIQSIYQERTIKRTSNIIKDLSHPATRYCQYLPSGRLCAFKGSKTVFILLQ